MKLSELTLSDTKMNIMTTLPLDYTFCVNPSCSIQDKCMRARIPETDKPLSMEKFEPSCYEIEDVDTDDNVFWNCDKFMEVKDEE